TTRFFHTPTAPTQISTLSLHDALPISATPATSSGSRRTHRKRSQRTSRHSKESASIWCRSSSSHPSRDRRIISGSTWPESQWTRSEEHTSELQSRFDLVCRLLLEKKNT